VSAGYFETMEMRVLRGRGIQRIDDERAPPVVVVSDGLARRLSPNGDIIGRRIRMGDGENPWRTVIGVVNETRESFTADAMPDVFVPYAQSPSAFLSIVVRTDRDEATLIEPIKRAVASVDAVLAMSEVESMSAVVARQTSSRRGMTALLSVFSGLALGLSVLGLYASLSYMVVQRRPELAVRLAVGADARAILRLVVGEGLLTAAFGVVTGALASLLLGRILQNQVYGVSTTDPLTLGVIALTLGVATIGACAVPGLRAARTDAALALRE
jgi:ABC-type antimicrobial peptide transport system permease subunit